METRRQSVDHEWNQECYKALRQKYVDFLVEGGVSHRDNVIIHVNLLHAGQDLKRDNETAPATPDDAWTQLETKFNQLLAIMESGPMKPIDVAETRPPLKYTPRVTLRVSKQLDDGSKKELPGEITYSVDELQAGISGT